MRIAVHHTAQLQKDNYAWRWISELEERSVEVKKLDFRQPNIIQQVADCDGAMWHFVHSPQDKLAALNILRAIELNLTIPVFPNLQTRWHFDDKLAQYYALDALNAPRIKTWVFYDRDKAVEFVHKAKYPLIFKLSVGAGSANVVKLESPQEAENMVKQLFGKGMWPYTTNEYAFANARNLPERIGAAMKYVLKGETSDFRPPDHWQYELQKDYAYFQEFLEDNTYDIRVTVIGGRAFGFVRHNRDNDFRASGSGKIDYDRQKVPMEAVKIAHDLSQRGGFQSMAYDFLRDKHGKLLIGEISYAYVNKAVYDCPGYWDRDLQYHEGNMWPETAQVEDFVSFIRDREAK